MHRVGLEGIAFANLHGDCFASGKCRSVRLSEVAFSDSAILATHLSFSVFNLFVGAFHAASESDVSEMSESMELTLELRLRDFLLLRVVLAGGAISADVC